MPDNAPDWFIGAPTLDDMDNVESYTAGDILNSPVDYEIPDVEDNDD